MLIRDIEVEGLYCNLGTWFAVIKPGHIYAMVNETYFIYELDRNIVLSFPVNNKEQEITIGLIIDKGRCIARLITIIDFDKEYDIEIGIIELYKVKIYENGYAKIIDMPIGRFRN